MTCPRALLLLAIIGGCGGQQGAAPEAAPEILEASNVVRIEPRDDRFGLSVVEQNEGVTFALLGAQRLELRASGESHHALSFTSAIARAGRCGEGWLFLSSDGVLAYSPRFTAPLERVLEVPTEAVPGMTLSGPTFVHARGSLLQVDCSNGVRVVDLELDFPINAIDDGQRIVATTRFGLMSREHDAEGWRRLDLGGRVAWVAMMSDTPGESYVWLSEPDEDANPFVLSADDSLRAFVPPHSPAEAREAEQDFAEHSEELRRVFARAFPSLASYGLALYGTTPTLGGAWLRREDDQSITFHDGNGRAFAVTTPQGERHCYPYHWPNQAIIECDDTLYRVIVDETGARTEEFGTLPADRRLFYPVGAQRGLLRNADGGWTWFDVRRGPGEAFETRSLDVRSAGDRVVLREYSEAGGPLGGWLHAAYGDASPTPLPEPFFSGAEPIVAADGSLWTTTRLNDGTIEGLFTMVGSEVRSVPVPEGAITFRVRDRETFWLAGSATDVLQSVDGGAGWQTLPSDTLDGRAPEWDLAASPRSVFERACLLPCDLGFDASVHQVSETPPLTRVLARNTPRVEAATDGALYECLPAEPLTLFDGEPTQVRGRDVRWTGVDGRGTYRERARLPSGSSGCRVLQFNRRDALVRCGGEDPESELFVLTPGSTAEAIPSQVRGHVTRTGEAGAVIRGNHNQDSISGWTRDGGVARRDFPSTDHVGERVLAILEGRPAHGFLRAASPNTPEAYVMRFLDGSQERVVIPVPVDLHFCDPLADPSATLYSIEISGLRLRGLFPAGVVSFRSALVEEQPTGACVRRVSSSEGFEAWAGPNAMLRIVRRRQSPSVYFVHAHSGEARDFTDECSVSLQACAMNGQSGAVDVRVTPGAQVRFDLGETTLGPNVRGCLEEQLAQCTSGLLREPFDASIRVFGSEPLQPMSCEPVAD